MTNCLLYHGRNVHGGHIRTEKYELAKHEFPPFNEIRNQDCQIKYWLRIGSGSPNRRKRNAIIFTYNVEISCLLTKMA